MAATALVLQSIPTQRTAWCAYPPVQPHTAFRGMLTGLSLATLFWGPSLVSALLLWR